MADKVVTICTREFMTNRLLSRKQFVSVSGGKPRPVCPGMFLKTVTKVFRGIYSGNVSGITAQYLEFIKGHFISFKKLHFDPRSAFNLKSKLLRLGDRPCSMQHIHSTVRNQERTTVRSKSNVLVHHHSLILVNRRYYNAVTCSCTQILFSLFHRRNVHVRNTNKNLRYVGLTVEEILRRPMFLLIHFIEVPPKEVLHSQVSHPTPCCM